MTQLKTQFENSSLNDNLVVKIKTILCEILNLDNLDDNASNEMYPEWDSMAYLGIIAALEDEFGVCINEDNIDQFDSIPNIIKIIKDAADSNAN